MPKASSVPAYVIWTFSSSARIKVFHCCMFHGEAERKGYIRSSSKTHFLGDDLSDPLLITRNGRRVPDIFEPDWAGLVVSEKVKNALAKLPNVAFSKVVFKKLIDFPYEAGDFSYYDQPRFRRNPRRWDPEKLLKRLPAKPELEAAIGSYYELVIAKHWEVAKTHPGLVQFYYETRKLVTPETHEIGLTPSLLANYPILRVEEGIMFSAKAFEVVSPFFDWDYFARSPVTLDRPGGGAD